MPSLTAHLVESGDHGRLGFHPDCPVCRQVRLFGSLSADPVISRRAQAALASGVLALSAVGPPRRWRKSPTIRSRVGRNPHRTGAPAVPRPRRLLRRHSPRRLRPISTRRHPRALRPQNFRTSSRSRPSLSRLRLPQTIRAPTRGRHPSPWIPRSHTRTALRRQPSPSRPRRRRNPPGRRRRLRHPKRRASSIQQTRQRDPLSTASPRKKQRKSCPAITPPPRPRKAWSDRRPPLSRRPWSPRLRSSPRRPPSRHLSPPRAIQRRRARPQRGRNQAFLVVQSGDSLWSIAKRLLGPDASAAQIARKVSRLWDLNDDRIGTGRPDLILVGTKLRLR